MSSDEDLLNDDEYHDDHDKSENELWIDNEVSFRKNYKVLMPTEIRRHLADSMAAISALLSMPPSSANLLLHRHRWSQEDVHNAWFSVEAKALSLQALYKYNVNLIIWLRDFNAESA